MCVLDRNSGAAIEMLDWLSMLSANGYASSSVTMSLFDGAEEYPFQMEIVPSVAPNDHIGSRIRLNRDGVEHNIFNVGTSIGRNVSPELVSKFIASAAEDIRRIRPSVVIGYGSRNLGPLRKLARDLGASTIFYLANDSYTVEKRDCFASIDEIVTPSNALSKLYKDRLGFDCCVIGNYLKDFTDLKKPTSEEVSLRRKTGFVTMVNPSLVKGGLFFLQIAAVMEKLAPNLTFLSIESRITREQMEGYVNNASSLKNVWWVQRQSDMHRVYQRSSLLLMPSLWFEAAGRIVPEAQMHGIPVLAHRVGALPDQMGNGGELFDIPDRLAGKFGLLPTPQEIAPWVSTITAMLGDDKQYKTMSRRALKAAAASHDPKIRAKQIMAFIDKQSDSALIRATDVEMVS
jgi:glycosyltransferase involved in cell wall biosynthesis